LKKVDSLESVVAVVVAVLILPAVGQGMRPTLVVLVGAL
jgi:hypothetical protein